ncbi:MAG: hypothetical protein M3007_02325 [Candidatus Eremiobacteraeota bacterium]|nr:hypothetical protein [Candidatus Eremiobacteraeota bacterium]
MKRGLVATALTAILLMGFSLNPPAPARALGATSGCSNVSAAGKWGYSYTGTLLLPTAAVPVASVGVFTQDAAGNVVGTQFRNVGGGSGKEVIKGKIAVDADCSATGTFNVYQAGVLVRSAVIDFVYVDNSREVRGIFEGLVLPNGAKIPVVITLDGKRQ